MKRLESESAAAVKGIEQSIAAKKAEVSWQLVNRVTLLPGACTPPYIASPYLWKDLGQVMNTTNMAMVLQVVDTLLKYVTDVKFSK